MRPILLLVAATAALAQTSANGVNFFSIEKEIALGNQLAAEFQAHQETQPDAHLQAIGDRLAAQTDGTFQYRFLTYATEIPAAEPVALPGGPVFVAQSMLSADNDSLAAILAHAIAHIALRHYTREETQRDLMEIGAKQAPLAGNASVRQAMDFRIAQSNRRFDLDADQLAVKLMIGAGYDPQAIVRWLQSLPVPKANLALGDRPSPDPRVLAVQKAIAQQTK